MPKQAARAAGGDGLRGPVDHHVRDQIIVAAMEHFSLYGYEKTTISDLARSIGFSKAYIYKFFDSKAAVGEAICSFVLKAINDAVDSALDKAATPTHRLRRLLEVLPTESAALFFRDRKLYDIAALSALEDWPSFVKHRDLLQARLQQIVAAGRASREFERRTPVDEVVRAISRVMQPFINPLLLQYSLDALPDAIDEVTGLVLRSLAP